ncbi:MAG: nicotinate (nicotinamide) nucleotide adenylyltransferase [Spirochaetia bacterium]
MIVFGGSFDPIHKGHLGVADFARKTLKAHRVLFLPSAMPFFKKNPYESSISDRIAMMESALAPLHWADLCLYEVKEILCMNRPHQHFMIDTIRALKERGILPSRPYLLIGDDQVNHFHQWKEPQILSQEVYLLIALRNKDITPTFPYEAIYMKNPPVCCASSQIRELIKMGQKYRHLLPREVYQYIESHKVY